MNTTFTINLSTDAITREVLAVAALNSLQYNINDEKSPLLNSDHKPAFLSQTKGSLSNILLHIIPYVASCNIGEELPKDGSDHIFRLELHLNKHTSSSDIATLRQALEHTIAFDILYVCYMDHNAKLCDRYATLAQASLDNTLRLLSKASIKNSKRVMNWI